MVSGDALQGYVASQLLQEAPQPPQEQEDAPVEEDAPPPEEEEEGALPMEEGAVDDWAVPTEELFIPPEAVHEQPASRPGGHRRIVGHRRSAPPERVRLRVPDELDRQPRDPVAPGGGAPAAQRPLRSGARDAGTPLPCSLLRPYPPAPPRPLFPPPRPAAELLLRHPGGVAASAVVVRARGGRLRVRGDAVDGAAAALRVRRAGVAPRRRVVALQRARNGPSYRCSFARRAEFDAAHAAERIDGAVLEAYGALGTAALLTAAAFGPMGPWCFVSPSDDDLGLFARVDLVVGQAIGEYGGPRLPAHHHRCGRCVLLIPGTSTIIDAACENSPYDDVPRYPATFVIARWPNARLETWADAPGGGAPTELRERMWLVALEPIPPAARFGSITRRGARGGRGGHVLGARLHRGRAARHQLARRPPRRAAAHRRRARRRPPSRPQRGAPRGVPPPPPAHDADADADGPSDEPPLAWGGDHGGDVRLRTLVPLLLEANPYNWALIATHVHGRSGRECQQRWRALMREAATSIPEGEAAAAVATPTRWRRMRWRVASSRRRRARRRRPSWRRRRRRSAEARRRAAASRQRMTTTCPRPHRTTPFTRRPSTTMTTTTTTPPPPPPMPTPARRSRPRARAAGKGAAWQGARRPRRARPPAGAARSDHGGDGAAGAAGRAVQARDGETGRLQLLHAPFGHAGPHRPAEGKRVKRAARALRLRDR